MVVCHIGVLQLFKRSIAHFHYNTILYEFVSKKALLLEKWYAQDTINAEICVEIK